MPEARVPGRTEGRLSWDPRYQPCIPAVALDGTSASYSLCDLLSDADGLITIKGTTPGETVAVIEYLLAVCFASTTCPSSPEEWRDWIEQKHSLRPVSKWLARQPEREWDLFSPTEPLGQNIKLAPDLVRSGTGPAQLVIEHVGDYSQHFDHHHLEHSDPLPVADAFRAMLTQHVYGPYGRARISGSELGPTLTNLAAGRLQARIRVVALGQSLGETLRLNLHPPEGDVGALNLSWTTGTVQRRGFRQKATPRMPTGFADLHSTLGRSVLLHPSRSSDGGIVVDRVVIGAGEVLELDPQRHLQDAVFAETLSGQSKPLWPSPTRAKWADAHALYGAVQTSRTGLFARLRSLRQQPRDPEDRGAPYQIWTVGMLANKTLPVAWTQGAYPYAPAMARHLHHASYRGSRIAEYIASSLKRAAVVACETVYPAAHAAQEAGQLARFDGRWEFWPDAEPSFHHLLDEVIDAGFEDDDDPVSEPLIDYADALVTSARTHLARRLDSLPPNNVGHRARARAEQRFEVDMASGKAPAEIRGEIAHD